MPAKYPQPSGDPSLTTMVMGSAWTMTIVAACFLGLRLYCRLSMIKKLWWDDCLLLGGWIMFLVTVILQTQMGREGYMVTALSSKTIGPMNLASDSASKISLALSKTSFAITLVQIVPGWERWLIYFVVAAMNFMCIFHAVMVWRAMCGQETSYSFKPCWAYESGFLLNFYGAIISAVTDLVLTLLPIRVVFGLQMMRREKIGIALAMSMGLLAAVVAVIRAVEAQLVPLVTGPEFSYRLSKLTVLVLAEPCAAIVAASIPVLRVLIRDTRKKYSSGEGGGSGPYIRSTQSSTLRGQHSANVSAKASGPDHDHDNDSETSILPSAGLKAGIQHTRQITVEYEDRHRKVGATDTEDIELQDRLSNWKPAKR